MTIYVAACPIGIFAVEDKRVVAFRLFPKEPSVAARKLKDFQSTEEFKQLVSGLKDFSAEQPNQATEFLQANVRQLAKEKGFVKDEMELNKFLTQFGAELTKQNISKMEKRDKLIMQVISAVNDMDKVLNSMSERLREWYGLHYPEYKPKEHEKFAEAVAKFGLRENFENFKNSMGMALRQDDIETVKVYADNLSRLYKERADLEKYLIKVCREEMPNCSAVAGEMLAARLLAFAGGLERLAKMPSSTLQLLGAEKSLFRALKEKRRMHGVESRETRVPRFGILFTHPDVSGAPNEQRGKIARLLAAKISIAARTDFYTKEDHVKDLIDDYKRKLQEVRKGQA